jgi:tRNA(Arg) A34 adenosine deaminase TadA
MTCAKRRVWAVLTGRSGRQYLGTNDCATPVVVCPRAAGEGYEKCKSICNQGSHAEIDALRKAGDDARGGTVEIIGHDHACGECVEAMAAAGIVEVKFAVSSRAPWRYE